MPRLLDPLDEEGTSSTENYRLRRTAERNEFGFARVAAGGSGSAVVLTLFFSAIFLPLYLYRVNRSIARVGDELEERGRGLRPLPWLHAVLGFVGIFLAAPLVGTYLATCARLAHIEEMSGLAWRDRLYMRTAVLPCVLVVASFAMTLVLPQPWFFVGWLGTWISAAMVVHTLVEHSERIARTIEGELEPKSEVKFGAPVAGTCLAVAVVAAVFGFAFLGGDGWSLDSFTATEVASSPSSSDDESEDADTTATGSPSYDEDGLEASIEEGIEFDDGSKDDVDTASCEQADEEGWKWTCTIAFDDASNGSGMYTVTVDDEGGWEMEEYDPLAENAREMEALDEAADADPAVAECARILVLEGNVSLLGKGYSPETLCISMKQVMDEAGAAEALGEDAAAALFATP
ncbi:MAG TPA: hypothetical protein VNJ04_20890 [Gemmatimonadaceae bacterium]|nr:hypothetical protein [Gemmatimonadaceae bacterium]